MRRYRTEFRLDEMACVVTDVEGDQVILGYFSQTQARDIAGALNAAYEQGVKAGCADSQALGPGKLAR